MTGEEDNSLGYDFSFFFRNAKLIFFISFSFSIYLSKPIYFYAESISYLIDLLWTEYRSGKV